jgi:sorting nexin-7/30/sorting nexin-8
LKGVNKKESKEISSPSESWVNIEKDKNDKNNKIEKNEKNEKKEISSNKNEIEKEKEKENEKGSTKDIDNYGITTIGEIKCQTMPINDISKFKNIKIEVGPFEKVVGKLFSKSYVTYLIITKELNWKVKRRFSDFEWLRQILVTNYNYCLIPCIPKKKKNINKLAGEKYNEAFLRQRRRKFEKFLNYLINDPILKNTQPVYDFLSIEKEDDFNKKKKTYEKMKPSNKINDFFTLDGTGNIEINKEKEKYVDSIKENASENENNLKKINSTIKSIKDDLFSASNKFEELSKNWALMKERAIKSKEKDEVVQCYEELSSMFENFSSFLQKQTYFLFIHLREYFKFVKNNYRSMKEFIHIEENLKNSFYKSMKNLISKKEDLFKKQEIAKWELDPKEKIDRNSLLTNKNLALEKILYKDTNAVSNQKQLYGFYLNRIISEHERMQKINAQKHLQALMSVFERQTNSLTEFITSIADNTTALTTIQKGKKAIKKKENKSKNKDDDEVKLDLEVNKEEGENQKESTTEKK